MPAVTAVADLAVPFEQLVTLEGQRAAARHAPVTDHDEGLAVLEEEADEVRNEVYRRTVDPDHLVAELVQVASVCARWATFHGMCKWAPFALQVQERYNLLRGVRKPAATHHQALTRLSRHLARLRAAVYEMEVWGHAGYAPVPLQNTATSLVAVATEARSWTEDLLAEALGRARPMAETLPALAPQEATS